MTAAVNTLIVFTALAIGGIWFLALRRGKMGTLLGLATLVPAAAVAVMIAHGAGIRGDWLVNVVQLLLAPVTAWALADGLRRRPRVFLPLVAGIALLFGLMGGRNLFGAPPWATAFWLGQGAPGSDLAIAVAAAGGLVCHMWVN